MTAYYTGRNSRATWRPDMPDLIAKAIGIDPRQMPRDEEMSRLFEARRADNGEAWSAQKRKLSGFDLVFSPHKSVTLAAEFAPTPSESAAICNAVDRANDRTMRYVAQVVGWARKGAGGQDGADPGAVGWISFRHNTARPTLWLQDGEHASGKADLVYGPAPGGNRHRRASRQRPERAIGTLHFPQGGVPLPAITYFRSPSAVCRPAPP